MAVAPSASTISDLRAMIDTLRDVDPKRYAALEAKTLRERAKARRLWTPNAGPQTMALECEADELFYGGQAGGGKSNFLIGLSLTEHTRSLLLRRTNKEAATWVDDFVEIIGDRDGWNGQDKIWRRDGRIIELGGCQYEDDKQGYKGRPHDLKGFDEVADFTESQYVFIIGWNRSTKRGQRCRVVCCGNPPTRPEGLWVLKRWAAWLDPNHPNPALPGELRWYTTGEEGREVEVDGPGPHLINGEEVIAKSRTFIPAKLADNPDLAATNYAATLAALPEELRAAYRDGRFDVSLKDGEWQVIPTAWVRAAQDRWSDKPPRGVPMCAMGVDVAQGGSDETVIAIRHDGWFARLIAIPGVKTPDGASVAGAIVQHRRDRATVIIDMGGGYGGAAYEWMKNQEPDDQLIPTIKAYKGAEAGPGRTADRTLAFDNRRARAYWRFREALDPGQPGGSQIMLPPDSTLLADLTAPTFRVERKGIILIAKDKLVKLLGRSPDRGDAVVMAWEDGLKNINIPGGFARGFAPKRPQVIMGHGKTAGPRPRGGREHG